MQALLLFRSGVGTDLRYVFSPALNVAKAVLRLCTYV